MGRITADFRLFLESQLPRFASELADALDMTEPSVAVRINRQKGGDACGVVAEAQKVAWCGDGYYLDSRREFIFDPHMHQGRYYVQDASSMFQAYVVEQLSAVLSSESPLRPLRYLDACAAPGGKTTAAIGALLRGSLVVANEYDFRRVEVLKENVVKWGYPDVVVTRGDTARFRRLQGFFDIVAADVPCSGEGMMRKDDTACSQWSRSLVDECAARQREIVGNLWESLRPGGYLIYSTCTFNRCENEDVIEWMIEELGAIPVELHADASWGIVETGLMLRFLPSLLRGEGLAIGVVRKPVDAAAKQEPGGVEAVAPGKVGKHRLKAKGGKDKGGRTSVYDSEALRKQCGRWLSDCGNMEFMMDGDDVVAISRCHADALRRLREACDVVYAGISLGFVKGRDIWPSHALAMSAMFDRSAFPWVEVDMAGALSYLRREAPQDIDAPRGAVVLAYDGYPLGFVNHIGNRSNNLYPANWRILKR